MNLGFKGYHPFVNALFFISVITFGMLLRHPVCLAMSLIASTVYYLRISGSIGRKTVFGFLFPMLLAVVIINSFCNHYGVTTLFTLPSGNSFTFEALASGLASGVTVVSVIEWFFCFNEVVTQDKIMHVFGRVLPKGALVLSMILRFVPLYRQRYREISVARRGFDRQKETDGFIGKIRAACKNIGVLISWCFENAIETADSMKSRGYGTGKRTFYSRFRWKTGDTLAMCALSAADVAVGVGAALGKTYCIYNPYIIINPPTQGGTAYIINELNITFNSFTIGGTTTLAAYILLCFLPLIIDLTEDIKWNKLKSKI